MTFSEQFITIMDAVCEKFGIIIDWTAQNVFPYMKELCTRIVGFEIATSIFWIAISVISIIAFFCILKASKKWGWDECGLALYAIFGGCTALGFLICLTQQIYDIIQAKFIPEMIIMRFLNQFL